MIMSLREKRHYFFIVKNKRQTSEACWRPLIRGCLWWLKKRERNKEKRGNKQSVRVVGTNKRTSILGTTSPRTQVSLATRGLIEGRNGQKHSMRRVP
jgi:hypothetical protein